jgi:Homing endonuclease associated repeat
VSRKWTDQEILDALAQWAEKHGRPPKWDDWVKADPSHPASMTVWQRCGRWGDALILAGLEPINSPKGSFDKRRALQMRKAGATNQEIAKALGVNPKTILRHLGATPEPPPRPRTAAERREARIQALRRALEKNKS